MIHRTADVHETAFVSPSAKVWNWVQIREDARIGDNSIVSKGVYVDSGVQVGANVKIQNNVSIYRGVTVSDGVFIGPHVCFTNDKHPRAINPDGGIKTDADWSVSETIVGYGASIGANATITPGITIGEFAMVGAGAVVTRDVPAHGVVMGVPARLVGYACRCGRMIDSASGDVRACAACESREKEA